VAIAGYATLPLALGPLGVHTLFRLEWNVRQATVVGMIGAGGIGQALYESQQLFFYSQMIAYLLLTWILVIAVDRGSEWTRRRFGWMQLAPEEIAR
jgi:phosphonate transport system permease protein